MRVVKITIEGDILGKPLLHFDDSLNKISKARIGTQIEFMDPIFRQVEQLLSDGHIKSIVENCEKLQQLYSTYKAAVYERERRAEKSLSLKRGKN